MQKILVIVGPTGVGKTKLSIALAKEFDYEIISGDSMQIYKGMDIGTAKVTKEEMKGIVHHLINIKEVNESYSCADFQTEVRKKITEILEKGKKVMIVGGTGLYLRSCLYDYTFSEEVERNTEIIDKYAQLSNEELYQHLTQIDEESAKILHPNNRRRVLRAIEIYEKSGKTKSENLSNQTHKLLYDALILGLDLNRETLHKRQDARVDKMIEDGLENEVRNLYEVDGFLQGTASKAIGYKEFFPYFLGKITLDEVIKDIKIHTHQYTKRQYTWFRNQMDVNWINVNVENFDQTINEAKGLVNEWLKLSRR